MAAVQEAQDTACYRQGLGAAALGLGGGLLLFIVTRSGAAGAAGPGQDLLPLARPQSCSASDGGDDPVHLILTLLHLLPILITKETRKAAQWT